MWNRSKTLRNARLPGTAAAVTAALLWAAYPQTGLWPLTFVAYAPLLVWLEGQRPAWRAALLWGWLTGVALHAATFAFLALTMREMSGLPAPVGWLVVAAHAAGMGLHQGVLAAMLATTARPQVSALRRAAEVALALAVVEFALPWLFRWYLGNAFYRAPLWIQLADVVGVIGVSAAAIAVAYLAARAWLQRSWRPIGLAALLLTAWAGYGAVRLQQVDAATRTGTFSAVIVQHNATFAEKRAKTAKDRLPMLDRLQALTDKARAAGQLAGADAVIWPEGAYPLFWVADDVRDGAPPAPTKASKVALESKRRMLGFARTLGVPLLTGTLRRPDLLWLQDGHNSAVLLDAAGERWHYDKRILLPFGEYLPGTHWFPALRGAIEGISDFEPGHSSGLVQLGRAKAFVNICYEALFADFFRTESADAQVLINLTNDLWFGAKPAGELHLMVHQARAVELRRPMIRSTVTGITAVMDAAGRIVQETPIGEQAIVRADLPLAELWSPYRWWGDAPLWLATAGVLAWAVSRLWRSIRPPAH